jgi:hypothetical protein
VKLEDMTLDVEEIVEVKGSAQDVFKSVLYRFGEGCTRPDGESIQLQMEPWAGGRWFRDRGEGIQHLWGHVQAIKPGELLELSGPMFMSYPALNHVEIRLEEIAAGTKVTLRHRVLGMIDPEHRENVVTGWKGMLDLVDKDFSEATGTVA